MPVTDLLAADYMLAAYGFPNNLGVFGWDFTIDPSPKEDIRVRVKVLGDSVCIVVPGSEDVRDWTNNLRVWEHTPKNHPELGPIAPAFDAPGAYSSLLEILRDGGLGPKTIIGHSRGAGQVCNIVARAAVDGLVVDSVILCGCPRPGGKKLAEWVLKGSGSFRNYRNDGDLITAVPFNLIGFEYEPVPPYTNLDISPRSDDPWGPLAPHHFDICYYFGIKAEPMGVKPQQYSIPANIPSILKALEKIMSDITDLQAAETANASAIASAIALITSLAAQVASSNNSAQVEAAVSALASSTASLNAAVTAATPTPAVAVTPTSST